MDVKDLVKFQMMSHLGTAGASHRGAPQSFIQMFHQILMFLLISMIDDICKVLPQAFVTGKTFACSFFVQKVQENLDRSKNLQDTSIGITARHPISSFVMTRNYYTKDDGNSKSSSDTSEADSIVDAMLSYVAKLNNIPKFNLISSGQAMITYMEKPIQITKDIYMKLDAITEDQSGNIGSIKLSLLSNAVSAAKIIDFVEDIHKIYLEEMNNSLGNKIYFFDQKTRDPLPPPPPTGSDPHAIQNHKRMIVQTAPKQLSYTMSPFYSNKQFSNIYGDEVRLIEKRVRFFMENRDWYDSKGIPYQLGLMLSGVPGSGKTSAIRAIANLTKRHIVNVNFANITTATQLKNMFYSEKIQVYTDQTMSSTQTYYIPIDQRLYVLEEIDAIGNIVRKRTSESSAQDSFADELTLADILTVLDGTMEIPGRIVIMTTNHPDVLDDALVRPGRVDVNVKFGHATRELIAEMFGAYLDKPFPVERVGELPEGVLTPAEVGQAIFKHFDSASVDDVVRDLCAMASAKKDGDNEIGPVVMEALLGMAMGISAIPGTPNVSDDESATIESTTMKDKPNHTKYENIRIPVTDLSQTQWDRCMKECQKFYEKYLPDDKTGLMPSTVTLFHEHQKTKTDIQEPCRDESFSETLWQSCIKKSPEFAKCLPDDKTGLMPWDNERDTQSMEIAPFTQLEHGGFASV